MKVNGGYPGNDGRSQCFFKGESMSLRIRAALMNERSSIGPCGGVSPGISLEHLETN